MTTVVEFDFREKAERTVPLGEVCGACADGRYCWIDFEGDDLSGLRDFLLSMGLDLLTVESILEDDTRPRFNVYPSCLHFTLWEARLDADAFRATPVQVILGARFLLTCRGRDAEFLRQMRQTYREDFYAHSQSPGFLLFELADHLTHTYRLTLSTFSERIEGIEQRLFSETNDRIFLEVSDLIRSLLEFRKHVIASREIVHELATRRSPFISESTQPYLEKKGLLLERLSADATTEREVLSECLNLYMGIVSYRTNLVVTRLTVISAIFLPLTFLVGLYGMNFKSMPEIHWRYGYLMFWGIVAVVVSTLLTLMRRKKWL